VPAPFPFARLNALQAAVKIITVYQTNVFARLHKQINLLANSGDAFMNLSSAAGDLVTVNHLIEFVEPISKPTN
jgi:hypothetical protein